jgi:4-hydroxy-tetrahydrodipicolinate synthase
MNETVVEQKTIAAAQRIEAGPYFGIWCPALTPLDLDLQPDAVRFAQHVGKLFDDGCHGVAVFGTTGEANSFSVAERRRLLDEVLRLSLPAARLMVGTGCCALTDTVELTRHAVDSGCRTVLMLPPFYYKNNSDDALYRSYAQVIERVASDSLRVVLYNFPKLSGVPISPALVARLARAFPHTIVGVKDSSGDWNSTAAFLADSSGLAIFPGTELLLLRGLRAGAAGCITATANVNAAGLRAVYDAWRTDDASVERCADAADTVRRAVDRFPMIAGLKSLVSARYAAAHWLEVRPPLLALDNDAAVSLTQALESIGFCL